MRFRHLPAVPDSNHGASSRPAAAVDQSDVLTSLPVPALVVDAAGRVEHWNWRAERLLERPGKALDGASLSQLLGRDLMWSGESLGEDSCVSLKLRLPSGIAQNVIAWVTMHGFDPASSGATVLITPSTVTGGDPLRGVPRVTPWCEVAERLATLEADRLCIGLGLVGLRAINDGFSRSVGDQVLGAVHGRLLAFSPPDSIVERISGNRFVVAVPAAHVTPFDQAGEAELQRWAEHLAQLLMDAVREPIDTPLGRVAVGCAVGIDLSDDHSGLVVLDRVNRKTATAVTRGPGTVVSDDPSRRLTRAARMAASLVDSVRNGLVTAHFQPIVELESGTIVGYEAMARWNHRDNERPDDAAFLEAARLTGVIDQLGDVIIGDAIALAIELRATDRPDVTVSVNASVPELCNRHYAERFARRLAIAGIPADVLQVEFKADLTADELALIQPQLTALRAAGIGVVLDGLDQSMPTHLALEQGIDSVKLAAAATDVNCLRSKRVLSSMMRLADELFVTVVATGIESREQHDLAIEAGCRFGQGHFYGMPVSIKQMGLLVGRPSR